MQPTYKQLVLHAPVFKGVRRKKIGQGHFSISHGSVNGNGKFNPKKIKGVRWKKTSQVILQLFLSSVLF